MIDPHWTRVFAPLPRTAALGVWLGLAFAGGCRESTESRTSATPESQAAEEEERGASSAPADSVQTSPPFLGARELEGVDLRVLPPVATTAPAADPKKPTPLRFAEPVQVDLSLENAGTWQKLDDGSRRWRLRIRSEGAQTLNLRLDTFDLPAGARFWIYDALGEVVQGPYTMADRTAEGELWTPVVPGGEVVLELSVPARPDREPGLRVRTVNHGFRGFERSRVESDQDHDGD